MNQSQKLKIVVILLAFFIFLAGLGFGNFISINRKTENAKIETKIEEISPTPTVSKFSNEDIIQFENNEKEIDLWNRCGDFLGIEKIPSSQQKFTISGKKLSPNCKYVLYFLIVDGPSGWLDEYIEDENEIPIPTETPFVALKNEGVFLLNTCNGKTERIYVPTTSRENIKINWIENERLSFSVDESEFIYSIIDKKYVKNKNN